MQKGCVHVFNIYKGEVLCKARQRSVDMELSITAWRSHRKSLSLLVRIASVSSRDLSRPIQDFTILKWHHDIYKR